MIMKTINCVTLLLMLAGCVSGPRLDNSTAVLAKKTPAEDAPVVAAPAKTIAQVDYQESTEEGSTPELLQPQSVTGVPGNVADSVAPQPLPPTEGLTMEVLEQMALGNSPAISQTSARIRALRGKRLQVGLPPNPTVGYVASEVGNEGAAGQQGGFVGQNFITESSHCCCGNQSGRAAAYGNAPSRANRRAKGLLRSTALAASPAACRRIGSRNN